jgi:carboxypeptidase family protein/PEGA domain-containing protein
MAGEVVVRGVLRGDSGDPLPGARVHLSTADEPVRSTSSGADGSFEVAAPARAGYLVTVLAPGLEAWRRRLDPAEGTVDLGGIEVAASERPPGIAGQAWDAVEDVPVTGGRAELRRGERLVGSDKIGGDGGFAVELSAACMLPPGSYALTLQVPGYRDLSRAVEVRDDATSYLLGRVELEPVTPA